MIKCSETRDDGSYKGEILAAWHFSNVGKSLLGVMPK